jgi:hypothetical protein
MGQEIAEKEHIGRGLFVVRFGTEPVWHLFYRGELLVDSKPYDTKEAAIDAGVDCLEIWKMGLD